MNIEEIIINKLKEEKALFFGDIEQLFEEYNYDYKGEKSIYSGENKSLLIWTGWNSETIAMLSNIMSKVPQVYCKQATYIEVLLMGKVVNLPIAKKTNYKYKKVHWLPSLLIWKE